MARGPGRGAPLGFKLVDVTGASGLKFRHDNGASGGKLLPETLGSGCAFLDYDADGWQDILLVNGMDWPGHTKQRSTLVALSQQSQRHIHRCHARRRPRRGNVRDGRRCRRLEQRRLSRISSSPAWARTVCFEIPGRARSSTSRRRAGWVAGPAFSTSALWVDFDRDGFLDLFVCNYVKWSADHDVFCSLDGKQKSYCTPEAYRGDTCWLFRNRGNGTFEDVTATSGVFDTSSKSLGVAMLDYDGDGWPDLFVANDTQPNKLYRNMKNGTFKDVAVEAGLAFSADGKARAGMGVDVGDFDNSGRPGLAITNFDNEMIGLYKATRPGIYEDVAMRAGIGAPSRNSLGFGCVLADIDLDGALDLIVVNGHIDDTVRNIRGNVGYAQAPHLFLNQRNGTFRDVAAETGSEFAQPRVGRGLAYGDFDRDGDLDLLVTTNNGPAVALSKRSDRREPQPAVPSGRHQVQSRRDWRRRANLSRRHVSVANGQIRFELSLAVGAAGDVRRRQARSWSNAS